MVHMVIKMKNQLKRRGSSTWKNPSSRSLWRPNFVKKKEKQVTASPKLSKNKKRPTMEIKDVDDEEYIAQGELLVLRRALRMQVKEDDKVQ
ncbi:hypothetical protein CK203_083610 [Vitis vinifera]|uniref:Uncharacterized protein n=1 Tax=Vitis vinifera TaxID=29760 RepID=A0A438BS45_VITVI|nr:hypothetical protein CK203_083610 [Vitis vinifera]